MSGRFVDKGRRRLVKYSRIVAASTPIFARGTFHRPTQSFHDNYRRRDNSPLLLSLVSCTYCPTAESGKPMKKLTRVEKNEPVIGI